MAKITFKEVNVLHSFPTHYREVYTKVYDELKDVDENIHLGWMTNVDDPYDVEFHVGARSQEELHDFIVKHADTLSELSPRTAEIIRKQYLHGKCCTCKPVDYKTAKQVIEGPEADGSLWYETRLGKTYTKSYVRSCWHLCTTYGEGNFVKVCD